MNVLSRFVLHNLLPALLAGGIAWLAVQAGLQLFRIRQGKYRICLLFAPLLKSTLVLLGLQQVLPWPAEVFGPWHVEALPAATVTPRFVAVAGVAILARSLLIQRARRAAVADAMPPRPGDRRLVTALQQAIVGYQTQSRMQCPGCEPEPAQPTLMVTDGPLHSPLVITDRSPTIVFPSALAQRLDDQELTGAMAHELAHLQLRRPLNCFSSEWLRRFVAINPFAVLMAAQLRREEEKACDDLAVAATGDPEGYAQMLLRSYRYAHGTKRPLAGALQALPQLMGLRPALSERIERLIEGASPQESTALQTAAFVAFWILIFNTLFRV